MKKAKRNISLAILAIFGYIITPVALIHALHGHEDTHCIPGAYPAFSIQHVHCKILQIEAQVYTSPEPVFLASLPPIKSNFPVSHHTCSSFAKARFANLRAPPLV